MPVLNSLVLAFSQFTRIPMPQVEWEPGNMRYLMLWLPLVGAVVGLFVAAWCVIARALGFGSVLGPVGIALVPVAVTGGIHLDGFADVVDALSSHADPARKREIMKDPHIGAFAAIGIAAYLLAYFGLATELPVSWRVIALLVCLHVMSRCGSALASTLFFGSGSGGTLTMFRDTADVRATVVVVSLWLAAAVIAALAMSPAAGLAMAACEAVLLAALNPFARKNFGGMSGDVAGFFLQVSELALLACIVVAAKAVGL